MLFTGRLTANAEVKAVKNDKQVINFTGAINQNGKTNKAKKRKRPHSLTALTGAIQVSPNT
jgi:single-strand DNA-binding protein